MKVAVQRKIDRIFGTLICGMLSLIPRKRISVREGVRPEKILVILLSEMGSLVLARPMFDYLKKKYPQTSLNVLLFRRNSELLEILDVIPAINIYRVDDGGAVRLIADSFRAIREIRKKKIDTVIDCELFSRISSIFSFLSGAKVRAGFHRHTQEGLFRGNFINRPVLYNPYHHISKQFLVLAKALDSEQVPTVKCHLADGHYEVPLVIPRQGEMREFATRFENDFPQGTGKSLVLLYPGGGLLTIRAWPLENFCFVAEDLLKNGYSVGIIGLKEDKKLADLILTHCDNEDCINLTGYTRTVRELVVLFHIASLLITNDGGPGHVAALTPIPSIIFYGPETPTLYGPLDNKAVNFYVPISCSPCVTAYNHRNSPCDGDNVCLKFIDSKEVLVKAYEILSRQGNSKN